jgi:hopanoid biosynthesis associated protein HpnK
MASAKGLRRLIVNADDFGASESINRAVIQAHAQGVLTSASLMVNGAAFKEAVDLARSHPTLGVGLHLTLCCGSSSLPAAEIPALVNSRHQFTNSPVLAGIKYFFSPAARRQLEKEISAQLQTFAATGLPMDHLNGHLHFHLHPVVFSIVQKQLEGMNISAMRLTYDPPRIDIPLGQGRWFYRLSHAFIFAALSHRVATVFRERGIRHTDAVFGLLENARVSESYILNLLKVLPSGDSELYSHPSLHEFKHEYEALISPRVKAAIREENITLIRYQDL